MSKINSNVTIRFICILAAGIIFIISFYLGSTTIVSFKDAHDLVVSLSEKRGKLNELEIFKNNILPALTMFVPGLGIVFGINAGYSTGFSIAALVVINPALRSIEPLSVFSTIFGAMEVIAYSTAMSRSGLLVYNLALKRKPWKKYALFTGIEIGIVILLILLGAIVEWNYLQTRGH